MSCKRGRGWYRTGMAAEESGGAHSTRDGWMGGWMGGWIDGWMGTVVIVYVTALLLVSLCLCASCQHELIPSLAAAVAPLRSTVPMSTCSSTLSARPRQAADYTAAVRRLTVFDTCGIWSDADSSHRTDAAQRTRQRTLTVAAGHNNEVSEKKAQVSDVAHQRSMAARCTSRGCE